MNNLVPSTVQKIQQLQCILEQMPVMSTDLVEQFTDHFFAPGVYMRTMFIPKDYMLVGKIHQVESLSILLKGKTFVTTSQDERILAEAPFIFTSKIGQKALYTVTDIWLTNIFHNPDDCRDLKELERRYIAPTYEEIQS